MKKTFVQVFTVEDIMRVTPCSFIVAHFVLFEDTASFPITADVLLGDNRFHHRDIDFPFSEPLGTLNGRGHMLVSVEY